MIDLVLENARVPATGLDDQRFAVLVQAIDPDREGPRHDGGETIEAETALKEGRRRLVRYGKPRIDDDVKWHWLAFPLGEHRRRHALQIFRPLFHHRQLQRIADLGS